MELVKKAALTLGTVAALTGGTAQAEEPKVMFYGLIDVYAAAMKADATDEMTTVVNSSGFTTSFVGAKTTMDLGGGLMGESAIEGFLRPDTGELGRFPGDSMFTRNTYIGLSGGFGSVKLGRLTTPYFISTIITNPFGGSFGFAPTIKHSFLGGLAGDSGWSSAIQYDTPSMGGVKASLLYSAGETADEPAIGKFGGSLFFSADKLSVTASAQMVDAQVDNPAAPEDDAQTAAMAGVSYNLGMATIMAQYFMMMTETSGIETTHNTMQLGASVPMGKAKVLASVAYTGQDTDGAETDRTTFALAYDYFLTKKIDLYAVGYANSVDAGTGYSVGAGGRVRF